MKTNLCKLLLALAVCLALPGCAGFERHVADGTAIAGSMFMSHAGADIERMAHGHRYTSNDIWLAPGESYHKRLSPNVRQSAFTPVPSRTYNRPAGYASGAGAGANTSLSTPVHQSGGAIRQSPH